MQRVTIASLALLGCAAPVQPGGKSIVSPTQPVTEWAGCFQRTNPLPAARACGTLTLARPLESAQPWVAGRSPFQNVIHLQHTLPLDQLVIAANRAASGTFGPFGSAWLGEGTTWNIQVGFRESEIAFAADDGSFVAAVERTADTLIGTWHRTCYGGCAETGTLRLQAAAR